MSNIVKIDVTFDLDALKEQIQAAQTIKGDEPYFEQLSLIEAVKKQLGDAEDQLKSIEADAKGLINAKAKALYGDNWLVIKGEKFKISRSKTGDMYIVNGDPKPEFVKVKLSVDSKVVDKYVTENSKLPTGIEVNDNRGESIRITIK